MRSCQIARGDKLQISALTWSRTVMAPFLRLRLIGRSPSRFDGIAKSLGTPFRLVTLETIAIVTVLVRGLFVRDIVGGNIRHGSLSEKRKSVRFGGRYRQSSQKHLHRRAERQKDHESFGGKRLDRPKHHALPLQVEFHSNRGGLLQIDAPARLHQLRGDRLDHSDPDAEPRDQALDDRQSKQIREIEQCLARPVLADRGQMPPPVAQLLDRKREHPADIGWREHGEPRLRRICRHHNEIPKCVRVDMEACHK